MRVRTFHSVTYGGPQSAARWRPTECAAYDVVVAEVAGGPSRRTRKMCAG